jgi:hypothetical protein
MYDHHSKKYIRLLDIETGKVLVVKVPYRYRRVMCTVEGRPVQALVKGDHVEIETIRKWETWVLTSIKFIEDTE